MELCIHMILCYLLYCVPTHIIRDIGYLERRTTTLSKDLYLDMYHGLKGCVLCGWEYTSWYETIQYPLYRCWPLLLSHTYPLAQPYINANNRAAARKTHVVHALGYSLIANVAS